MKQDKVVAFENIDQVLEAIKAQKPNDKQKREWREALLNSLSLPHLATHFLELFKTKIFDIKELSSPKKDLENIINVK